ncbi:helix-turn-helix transcriptional regulator [Veillonella caviae]|uniref:helix-turn-helix transcriptional regulator n=1 Tax=Veillonella caviae TaxID=248316 RepID=UPI0023F6AE10|nr:helix-turn-helix transcriptional regulator [Veillonella caviae]MDY5786672.1 helix-turn-helix transcriptional regulator [Veillonella caviae]
MGALERLIVIAHGLAVQFGNSCEVLIHDVRTDMDKSLVYIENGNISNRQIGDGPSHVVLDVLQNDDGSDGRFGYLTKTKEGRILRSTTIYIRDDEGQIQYLLGINQDITNFVMMHNSLAQIISTPIDGPVEQITSSVSDLLDDLLVNAERLVGKPGPLMNKMERLRAIKYLYEKGAFLISKSSEKIGDYFNVSKFTLYSDLNTVKEECNSSTET